MNTEDYWKVDKAETKEHWLTLIEPDGWYRATAKWDGCVDLDVFSNTPHPQEKPDKEYIHICDIDEMILRLYALKLEAQKHFGKDWPNI